MTDPDTERVRLLSERLAEVMTDPERALQVISEFEHAGRHCVVTIVKEWHYCGYVEAPQALTQLTSEKLREEGITAHGGITYQATGEKAETLTSLTELAPDAPSWLGFDCANGFNLCLDGDGEPLPVAQHDIEAAYWRGEKESEFPTQTWQPDDVERECKQLAESITTWVTEND